jgi:alkanesulfonate monooxygenase SsuD/methylene tetrahydromethanopterin reductase-like flavin-dependent oxidoreductase (luciferase family)
MQYAIYMPAGEDFSDPRTLAELGREAEQSGWDGFFIWDHVVLGPSERTLDPWVGLAAVAMVTERIRIGTMVTPIPRRRPWKLARETATLDRLSNGRLTLGVGIGLGAKEWDDLGEETSPKVRGEMLDEALQVLTGLWSGEIFSFEGKYYHVKNARFLPTPVQPHIPIWVGGFWPKQAPMRRAARYDRIQRSWRCSKRPWPLSASSIPPPNPSISWRSGPRATAATLRRCACTRKPAPPGGWKPSTHGTSAGRTAVPGP